MPLRVHCPSGCLIHMSINRAGRIVRCPQCKVAIRIPEVPESELASGKPVACQARTAKRRADLENDSTLGNLESAPIDYGFTLPAVEPTTFEQSQVDPAVMKSAVVQPLSPGDAGNVENPQKPRLRVPDLVKPVLKRHRLPVHESEALTDPEPLLRVHAVPEFENDESRESTDQEIAVPIEDVVAEAALNLQDLVDAKGADSDRIQETDQDTGSSDPEAFAPKVAKSEIDQQEILESATVGAVTDEAANDPETAEPESTDTEVFESELGQREDPPWKLVESFLKPGDDIFPDKIDFLPLPTRLKTPESIPTISLGEPARPEIVAEEERNWEERLERANADRRVLARFFAICLCFVAIVNMVPALYHWYHWTQLTESMALPRWIYIQIFVGAIHLVYAIFLFQINDWSAMRAVSVAMLAVAFVFGFISTGLLVGGGEGNLTGFLGIPYTLNRQACIWCVAMLCLATLMSYWGGRESTNWQRAEVLLKDILSRSPT